MIGARMKMRPTSKIRAHFFHGIYISGVSGKHPATHRQSFTGNGQCDNDLRTPGAFLGPAKFANGTVERLIVFILLVD